MKVRIIQRTRETERLGTIGEVVEVAGAVGNPLACIGMVVIIEHDRPPKRGPKSRLNANAEALNHLERETGKPYLPETTDEGDSDDGNP